MRAVDVMVRNVVTVHPETEVADAVKLLAEHDISALPVVDDRGALVGMLSEADLIHRAEIGTEKHRPWWVEAVTGASTLAAEYAQAYGRTVDALMTTTLVTVSEDTTLAEIASIFERQRIKRVPVVREGRLVGIVSRSNLIQALASLPFREMDRVDETDRQLRLELLAQLQQQRWTDFGGRNVTVSNRVVHLWGLVGSPEERRALLALAEGIPGVARVSDEMISAY